MWTSKERQMVATWKRFEEEHYETLMRETISWQVVF
jgi:hypothetical protein